MWPVILYGLGAVAGFYILAAIGISIAAHFHAHRTPEPKTLADEIREARREKLRKAFPGLLPEDRDRR
jgi:hypothetical protein